MVHTIACRAYGDIKEVLSIAIVQLGYIERMIKRTPHEGLPILPAAASFKTGVRGGPEQVTDVPEKDAAIKNVSDLYLYPSVVWASPFTGRQIRDWLERSAGLFRRVATGEQDVVFSNPSFPRCNFDVIDGVN